MSHHPEPFTRAGHVQALLDVEVALAEALAAAKVIPAECVPPIRIAADLSRYDLDSLAAEAAVAGNVVIPLVRHLTREVAAQDRKAAGFVHWGATSQDVIDTAVVLQLRPALVGIDRALDRAASAAAGLAARHAATPIAGRTWLQQASPTTFGAKAASWLDGMERVRARLSAAGRAASDLQLGGATGTLASLGAAGPAVSRALATSLGLRVAEIPWHAERSRFADVACALGLVCGTLGKIGRDLALLAQTEVAEAADAAMEGHGGSSSMPHKHNPVGAVQAVAASVRAPGLVATMLAAMPQEHERAAGGWQAEWEALPALVALTAGAAGAIAETLSALVVDEAQMLANLDAAGGVARAEGLVIALAPRLGRVEAMRLVEAVSRRAVTDGTSLAAAAAADPALRKHLDAEAIARALDPANLSAPAGTFVAQVLTRWRRAAKDGAHHG
jgi:3-carboxy-cis,cis-muconate cycloisomerase